METEYNDIPFDNLATSFDNSPNNIATSDELDAGEVYTNKMGTSYSLSKIITKVVVAAGILTTSIGGITMLKNSYIKAPTLTDNTIVVSTQKDELSYSFTIKNENGMSCLFEINSSEKSYLSLDVSTSNKYEGVITDIGYNVEINYKLTYSNNLDYTSTLWQGKLTTIKEVK
jgi:hypothetical protein